MRCNTRRKSNKYFQENPVSFITNDDLPLQRLYRWERARADQVFLTQPMGQGRVRDYSWAQAMDEVRRMAAYLRGRGYAPGTCIAILSKNCAHWLMMDYAIWMAGYVSVPLYPMLTAESVRQILEHCGAPLLFVGKLDDWATMRPGVPDGVHRVGCALSPKDDHESWEDIVSRTPPLSDSPVRAAEDLATIIYTSGTTGMPKGVMHSFHNFGAASRTMAETFNFTSGERVLSYLPLAHVAERVAVGANAAHLGYHVFFADSLDTFQQDLQRSRPTIFFSVPRLWVKFQQGIFSKMPRKKLDRLFHIPVVGRLVKKKILRQLGLDTTRFAATGAAPLPPEIIAWYRQLGLDLLAAYGMTENFALSHTCRPGQVRVGYVGSPWPHVECRLSDIGEVLVRAPWNMLGYYKEPEKTREAFTEDGYLRTGDLGQIDELGRLKIVGRAKEQFKTSKGKYVAPAPIENKLGVHPAIEAVCVTGASYPQPFAIAMLSPDAAKAAAGEGRAALETSLATLREQVNAVIDPHEHLAFIAVVNDTWSVDNGMITPTMKIKRAAVESTYAPRFDAWAKARKPVVWTF